MSLPIPVHVITGFLGSGKTTLLKTILSDESFGDTALLINEFGEVGLDDQLLGDIDQETILLSNGCVCCSIRGELSDALLNLASQRKAGSVPPFSRVIIETTGLADPGPIAATIANDVKVKNQFLFGAVLAVVDTQHALNTRQHTDIWTDQVAAADAIWFSKKDLTSSEPIQEVVVVTRSVNPSAAILERADAISLDTLFQQRRSASGANLQPFKELSRLGSQYSNSVVLDSVQHEKHDHLKGINSFQIYLDQSIDWVTFGVWLSLVLHRHGREILRVKGLLKLEGVRQPVAIHGVQHTLFPPEHIDVKDLSAISPHLIFITRGISEQAIRSSLEDFLVNLPRRIQS